MKKRIIACVIACAMLLMGTGYAYWTDLLNISTTARTGKLNVEFITAGYQGNNFVATGALTNQSAYNSADRSVGYAPKSVTIDLYDMFPGYYETFIATVENKGTVAAKLGQINANLTGDNSAARDLLGIAIAATSNYVTQEQTYNTIQEPEYGWKKVKICSWPIPLYKWVWDVIGYYDVTVPGPIVDAQNPGIVDLGLPAGSTFVIDGITFIRLSALANVEVANQVASILYLTNDSKMDFVISVGMDSDAAGVYTTGTAATRNGNDDAASQLKTEALTLGFVWDQYNVQ